MQVPQGQEQGVSEDAILDMLGPRGPGSPKPGPLEREASEVALRPEAREWAAPKKSCDRCNKEIPSGTHICPHCHTYIASLHDFQ